MTDTERLDWLEQHRAVCERPGYWDHHYNAYRGDPWCVTGYEQQGNRCIAQEHGETLRIAIDAAMKAEAEDGERD